MDKINFLALLVFLFATHLHAQGSYQASNNDKKSDQLLNNDLGRRSSREESASSQLSDEQVEQEEELELLAQSVVKEALRKVDTLKNEADKKEMMKLVTKFREIIFALIENHFQDEPLISDNSVEDKVIQEQVGDNVASSDEFDDEKYNQIIDEVIDQVVQMEKQKNVKKESTGQELQEHDSKQKKMNAFQASRNTEKEGLKPAHTNEAHKDNVAISEDMSDLSDQLVSELKGVKTFEKKYNLDEGPRTGDKQKAWVKYLIYGKESDKSTKDQDESKEEKGSKEDESVGSEEEQLMGLKASPKKGMLESTQIKGGQVDFTSGKKTQPPVLVHPTLKQSVSSEEDKKSPINSDVYSLINQMIALLKQADGKEEKA